MRHNRLKGLDTVTYIKFGVWLTLKTFLLPYETDTCLPNRFDFSLKCPTLMFKYLKITLGNTIKIQRFPKF